MDYISMNRLGFYGYHGVLEEEKKLGQKFFVSTKLFLDLSFAGKSDSVNDTVNYAVAYEMIKNIVEKEKYNLIEALADRIATVLLEEHIALSSVEVEVLKPEAPVAGIYDGFSVCIRRDRVG